MSRSTSNHPTTLTTSTSSKQSVDASSWTRDRWTVVDSFFLQHGFVSQQIESMNNFIAHDLPEIITQTPSIRVFPKAELFLNPYNTVPRHFYELRFDGVYLGRPCTKNAQQHTVPLYPQDAREQGLNYSAPLYVYMSTSQVTLHDTGRLSERQVTRETVYVGHFPIMLHTQHCWLGDRQRSVDLGTLRECLYDQGGYFIVHGNEKVLVAQEHIRLNRLYVFLKRRGSRDVLLAEVRSCRDPHVQLVKPLMVMLNSGGANPNLGLHSLRHVQITVNMPCMTEPLEPALLFKALGVLSDDNILECISLQKHHAQVSRLLHASLRNTEHVTTQEQAFIAIGHALTISTRNAHNQPDDAKALDVGRTVVSRDVLPHLATNNHNTADQYHQKALYFGYMIMRLVVVYHEPRKQHDRDHYANKRIDMSGSLFRLLFTQQWQKLTKKMTRWLQDAVQNGKPLFLRPRRARPGAQPGPLKTIAQQSVQDKIITQGLRYALSTGKWPHHIVYHNNDGVSQELKRTTYAETLSHLRRITTPIDKQHSGGKMTKPRQLHNTHWGLLCPDETPEGSSCGQVKNLALMCVVSNQGDVTQLRRVLFQQTHVARPEHAYTIAKQRCQLHARCKVFINGRWEAVHPNGKQLYTLFKQLKQYGVAHPHTSVVWDQDQNVLHLSTDEGRGMHPLLVVDEKTQRLRLTRDQLAQLRTGSGHKLSWDDLVRHGVIEYLDCEEMQHAMVAMEYDHVLHRNAAQDNVGVTYTHCEIHPAMQLGVCASHIPYPDRNQAPRNMYYASMSKQAISLPVTNMLHRFDTLMQMLQMPMKPLVSTHMANIMRINELPSGQQIMLLIGSFSGYNQEDALILNQGAVDRGLMRSTSWTTYQSDAKRGEDVFEKPTRQEVNHMNQGNYEKLNAHGEVPVGTRITQDDIILGKTRTHRSVARRAAQFRAQHPNARPPRVKNDQSKVYDRKEDAIVEAVIRCVTPKKETRRVRVRSVRIPERGDKFASRHGQKGTVGIVLPEVDMPYTLDGTVPDAIMNPHGLTSRMTMGHIQEMPRSVVALLKAMFQDGTPFQQADMETFHHVLKENGITINANQRLVHPHTGELMEGMSLMLPIYYHRLKHMVKDKAHARARGAYLALTRQPTEGKRRNGGQRVGEMERDTFLAYGASAIMRERLFTQSDPYSMMICSQCGFPAICNARTKRSWCIHCNSNDDIYHVNLPYACKLLLQEMMALHLAPRITPKTQT